MAAPRTTRRIDDGRARVADATWQLLDDREWEEVTVADICAAADVAPRTFHRWFPDKAELLFADATSHEARLRDVLTETPSDPTQPRTLIDAAIQLIASQVAAYPPTQLRRRREVIRRSPELSSRELLKRSRLEQVTTLGLATRYPEHHRDRLRLLSSAAVAAFFIAMDSWAGGDTGGGDLAARALRALDGLARDLS